MMVKFDFLSSENESEKGKRKEKKNGWKAIGIFGFLIFYIKYEMK